MNNRDEYVDQMANRRFCAEYLLRTYIVFILQLLVTGIYLMHPGVWWTSIQVSLITSPLIINVGNQRLLHLFYPFKLAGMLIVEFLILQYFTSTRDIFTSLLGLLITLAVCSWLFAFTYFIGKVIVFGLPPARTAIMLLTITAISHYFKNRLVFDICTSVKYSLVIYYVLFHSCIIQPTQLQETLNASIKLHGNFILALVSAITILNYV